jgi:uncharacterized protein YecE (DUF72 family)
LDHSSQIKIGTASWNIPTPLKPRFSDQGTHLERYSRRLNCVEVNSTFYREHKRETFEKWKNSTPAGFCFSVKLSRIFTHELRLKGYGDRLRESLRRVMGLGEKFRVLLIQLPKSFEFDMMTTERFLQDVRSIYPEKIAWEPRHMSWSANSVLDLFQSYQVVKVQADPDPCPAHQPVKYFQYLRMHGTPEMYRSKYSPEVITDLVRQVSKTQVESWCIFDNTTFGYATENALEMSDICHVKQRAAGNEVRM